MQQVREAPAQHQDSVLLLFALTDRLLNACAAAVAAAPVGQHRRLLHQAYAALRERLLAHLLQQAYVLCLHGGGRSPVPSCCMSSLTMASRHNSGGCKRWWQHGRVCSK